MTQTELVADVSLSSHLSKKDVQAVLSEVLAVLGEALTLGEKVTFSGFGTFLTVSRPDHPGRNPKTGLPLDVPARTFPRFSPGKPLREAVALSGRGDPTSLSPSLSDTGKVFPG